MPVLLQSIVMAHVFIESSSLMHTVKISIQKNPGLTALLIFIILVIDTCYVYRTLKWFWGKSITLIPSAHNLHKKGTVTLDRPGAQIICRFVS